MTRKRVEFLGSSSIFSCKTGVLNNAAARILAIAAVPFSLDAIFTASALLETDCHSMPGA